MLSILLEKHGLLFIETSAKDSTNVETAFQTFLTGENKLYTLNLIFHHNYLIIFSLFIDLSSIIIIFTCIHLHCIYTSTIFISGTTIYMTIYSFLPLQSQTSHYVRLTHVGS